MSGNSTAGPATAPQGGSNAALLDLSNPRHSVGVGVMPPLAADPRPVAFGRAAMGEERFDPRGLPARGARRKTAGADLWELLDLLDLGFLEGSGGSSGSI